MKKDFFNIAVINLKHRKLRTWLTVLGIVIGIAAIVALITISSGLENAINDQFEQMGSNRVFVYAKGVMANLGAEGITYDDLRTLDRVSEIEWACAYLYGSREANKGRDTAFIQNLFGMDIENAEEALDSFGVDFTQGRVFKENERGVAVLGYRAAKDLFSREVKVGEKITVENVDLKIIGVLDEIGNPDDDNNVYIPMEDAREILDEPDKVTMIDVKLKEGVDIDDAADKIKKELERARDDENFDVVTPKQLLGQVESVLGVLNIVLGGIAAISILVGGVGIMNSTYTSVLERTKEIGIMKAIGAQNKDIRILFLIESGLIGIIGGLIGIGLGTLISFGASQVMSEVGFSMIRVGYDWKLWVFSLIFSFTVGVISGYFPAKKASSMKPVDAIRGPS